MYIYIYSPDVDDDDDDDDDDDNAYTLLWKTVPLHGVIFVF